VPANLTKFSMKNLVNAYIAQKDLVIANYVTKNSVLVAKMATFGQI